MKILSAKSSQDPKHAFGLFARFLDFLNDKARREEIAHGTVINHYKSVKSFCDTNSISLNWTSGSLPSRKSATDRDPTFQEIRRLVEYPDPRIKSIVFMMASGGFRVGASETLQMKRVFPQVDKNKGKILAAIAVYHQPLIHFKRIIRLTFLTTRLTILTDIGNAL